MTVLAAIDCGTNTTRLLVSDDSGRVLDRRMVVTRLGEGVHDTRRLSNAAIDRTVGALGEFRQVMESHGVDRFIAAATSAARDAVNAADLFDACERALGARPVLLTGEEEGRLTYLGATSRLGSGRWTVVDIGGGSTELATVNDRGDVVSVSADVGAVRLTELALRSDPNETSELQQARAIAADAVAQTVADVADLMMGDGSTLIGVGGTITTVAALDLELESYDPHRTHQHVVGREKLAAMIETLGRQPLERRRRSPGMPPDRAEIVVAGMIVLDAVMERLRFSRCTVSEAGILDGLIAGLAGSPPEAVR